MDRYHRQTILPEIGSSGQAKLRNASVLVVGVGGLGSIASAYLNAAGVGRLGLIDFDRVDASNLHRQLLFSERDIGSSKLSATAERLRAANGETAIEIFEERLTSANALPIIERFDLVLDGTDNFATRYLVNDACVMLGKPNVYGSVYRFDGQVSIFATPTGPCYRCVYPSPPPPDAVPSCAEGGVIGVLPGVIGVMQATEAIKWITGAGETLAGRLLLYDALRMEFRQVRLKRRAECPACGTRENTQLIDYDVFCGGSLNMAEERVSPAELKEAQRNGATIVDVREQDEWNSGHIEGAILLPLSQLEQRAGELEPSADLILYCGVGGRSLRAAQYLRQRGLQNVRDLDGGIGRWRREGNPTV